jgi:hypothetical protein
MFAEALARGSLGKLAIDRPNMIATAPVAVTMMRFILLLWAGVLTGGCNG